jgi:hypothetical protein
MEPYTRFTFDPRVPGGLSPEKLREHALAMTRRWMAALDGPPSAEDVFAFAEGYAGERGPTFEKTQSVSGTAANASRAARAFDAGAGVMPAPAHRRASFAFGVVRDAMRAAVGLDDRSYVVLAPAVLRALAREGLLTPGDVVLRDARTLGLGVLVDGKPVRPERVHLTRPAEPDDVVALVADEVQREALPNRGSAEQVAVAVLAAMRDAGLLRVEAERGSAPDLVPDNFDDPKIRIEWGESAADGERRAAAGAARAGAREPDLVSRMMDARNCLRQIGPARPGDAFAESDVRAVQGAPVASGGHRGGDAAARVVRGAAPARRRRAARVFVRVGGELHGWPAGVRGSVPVRGGVAVAAGRRGR